MGDTAKINTRIFSGPMTMERWLGASHQGLLDFLDSPANGAIKVILGRSGTGKTTVAEGYAALCESVVLGANGCLPDIFGLHSALLTSAGLSAVGTSDVERRNLLTVFIEHQRMQQRRVQILIDDAHLLTPPLWPELRRLQALTFNKAPAAELIFVGEAGFHAILQRPGLTGFQSIHARMHVLEPLPAAEVGSYVSARLEAAGLPSDLFTDGAIQMVARVAHGRFGVINTLCQLAMVGWDAVAAPRIDIRRVDAALAAAKAQACKKTPPPPAGAVVPPPEAVAPPPPPEQGEILVSRRGQVAQRCALRERLLIGRGEHNDLALDDGYLSRHHAAVIQTGAGYYIVDLNSANGLTVNAEFRRAALLSDQDVIGIGPYRMKFIAPSNYQQDDGMALADTGIMPNEPEDIPDLRQVK